MMYPQIVFHCIEDDMMDIDGETLFRSPVGGLVLWVVHLVGCAFGVLLSLDMLYPQIISHCIDDDMMVTAVRPCLGLQLVVSCCGLCIWCRLRN